MEVNKPEAAIILKREGRHNQGYKHDQEPDDKAKGGGEDNLGHHTNGWVEDDAFLVDGHISGPISPEVQGILSGLAAQIEPLKLELERTRARESDFHDRAQRHSYMPIFSRFGLENEFARVMGHIQNLGAVSFICVSILNAEQIRRSYGRQVYEDAMSHACQAIRTVIRQDDSMGDLGGHDLGVLVLASSDSTIPDFKDSLQKALSEQPVNCNGRPVVLEAGVVGTRIQTSFTMNAALDVLG